MTGKLENNVALRLVCVISAGFPQRLENDNGHGNVIEHYKLAKSHGIL